jgi:CubicO group peptidase (beta-lactamase class C family)
MSDISTIDVQSSLDAERERAGLPGAALAVLHDGEMHEFVSGHAALADDPVRPETLFRLGSVTKLYTATLVMEAVESGEVDLSDPVHTFVPELRFADEALADQVTIERLLTHSSGLDLGDVFGHFGESDDCVRRYVEGVSPVGFVHEPGATFSYCNGGFIILGRLIETVFGAPWDVVLKQRLLDPLGLNDTVTILEEDVVRAEHGEVASDEIARLARGHAQGGSPVSISPMAPVWGRSTAPAGSTLAATAADVARFVRFLISEDDGPLGRDIRRQMEVQRLERPVNEATWSGLGWSISGFGGIPILSHGGGHNGQAALALGIPSTGSVAVMLTNSARGGVLYSPVLYDLMFKLNGVSGETTLREDDSPIEVDALSGTYARRAPVGEDGPRRFVVEPIDDGIHLGEGKPIERLKPSVFRGRAYVVKFLFLEPGSDHASHVHIGNRAWKRV